MSDPRAILRPENYYHLFNHAVGSDNLFGSDDDYKYFLKKTIEHVVPVSDIFSYCLLPNHFHLILRINSIGEAESFLKKKIGPEKFNKQKAHIEYFLSDQISKLYFNLINTYANHYYFFKKRRGTLFKRTFRRKQIEDMA